MIPDLDQLDSLDAYRKHFMDAALWLPHVQAVCRRHNLVPCQPVRAGLAGSFPTFIVNDRWVVKFFGRLFGGENAYETELQVNRLLPPDLAIHAPALLHCGTLRADGPAWAWPYLVYEYLPGISIGEVYEQVSFEEKLALAGALGKTTWQILGLPLEGASLYHGGLVAYSRFLARQRAVCTANHRQWESLPERLIEQIDDYLLPVESLADPRFPYGLIHADITRDHILGWLGPGGWVTRGLIDFGDARVGNVFYDLGALHLDLFRGNKRLLQAYLDAYRLEDRRQFAHKAMSAALLHEFNIFILLKDMKPQLSQAATLEDLAGLIWDISL
jgi:hygromycin-B 7''-O-kinase